MVTVLLVEADDAIRSAMTRSLSERGHDVRSQPLGMAGLHSAIEFPPDVVLLDLALPDVDGFRVLSMLRAVSAVPVVVLSARDDTADIVRALDSGADDYVVWPFDADELEARLRAVLRRTAGDRRVGPVRVGGLCIDVAARRVTLDEAEVHLSPKTFDVLLTLARHADQVVTKRELLSDVWPASHGACDRTVAVHLSWLRSKLGESAAQPVYLHSVRGVGVRLSAPRDSAGQVAGDPRESELVPRRH